MAWTTGRKCPLIVYPHVEALLPDFAFVSGAFPGGVGRWTAAGASLPTVASGGGEQLGYLAKYNPSAAASSYLQTAAAMSSTELAAGTTGTMYWYARAKVASAGTNTAFLARLDYYNSSSVFISSASTVTLFTAGTTGPADSAWRIYRASFTATIPANTAKYGCVVGYFGAGPHTNETYVDWLSCGFVMDGQDMSGLSNYGATAVHPFRYGSTAAGSYGRGVAGKFHARRFHSGYKSGTISLTPFTETNRATWNTMIGRVADGTSMSVMYDQSDISRDFIKKTILAQDDDGLTQVEATPHWKGALEWREVP